MRRLTLSIAAFVCLLASAPSADDGEKLLTIDHYVRVKSTVPAIAGQLAQIYVRERVQAGTALRAPAAADRVVLFAPAYNRSASATPPAAIPADGVPMNTQSHQDFTSGWDRQVGCPDQYDPGAAAAVWSEMLASDPVGATWGPGVRRAPQTTVWG